MSVFLITPIKNSAAIGKTVAERFGRDAYQIPETGSWLVAYDGTARELSEDVGIMKGGNVTGVVTSVASYYGLAPTDLWEWMKTRMERE